MTNISEIKNKYNTEIGLVLLLCRLYFKTTTPQEVNKYIGDNNIDWQFLLQLMSAHSIRPFINKVIAEHRIDVDTAFREKLHKQVLRQSKANLDSIQEVLRLDQLFNNEGVSVIPVKGIILSQVLFGDFLSRETCDIDYFILPKDLEKVRQLLIESGYIGDSYYNDDDIEKIRRHTREYKMHKEFNNTVVKVELQWQATLNAVDIPLKNADLLNGFDTIQISGNNIEVLNMHNRLLVLIAHHGVNDIWKNIKHILDIAVLCNKYGDSIDWNELQQDITGNKLNRTAQVGFLIADLLFGVKSSVAIDNKAAEIVDKIILDKLLGFPLILRRRSFFKNIGLQLSMRDSSSDKFKMLAAYTKSVFYRL